MKIAFLISILAVLLIAGCTQQTLDVTKSPVQQTQSIPEMKTTTLNIEGMTCDMCVANVTGRLKGVEGVISANVSLNDKKAVVSYDPTKTNIDEMISSVNSSTKFKAYRMPEIETATLRITGMTCDMCVANVTGRLEGVEGVISANVSLSEKEAVVSYDPVKVSIEDLTSAVNSSTKFKAEPK